MFLDPSSHHSTLFIQLQWRAWLHLITIYSELFWSLSFFFYRKRAIEQRRTRKIMVNVSLKLGNPTITLKKYSSGYNSDSCSNSLLYLSRANDNIISIKQKFIYLFKPAAGVCTNLIVWAKYERVSKLTIA